MLTATSAAALGKRSHFRICLGVAPGSGKTIAMLDEGHRRRSQGADVVVAVVQTRGRPVTQQRIGSLEVIPPRRVVDRGNRFEELDTDAVLRREPDVALIDDLANANVPGSGRHARRWQDVAELLDAGIDVVATVDIQRLDSIADVAEAITGMRTGDRIPDWVVRQADQIDLVDATAEQLRRRAMDGSLYPDEQGPQALRHLLPAADLAVLRQVARHFLAKQNEAEFLRYLARYRTLAPWRITEHVMAGVTPAPGADAIVLRAAQIAETTKSDLDVVYVAEGASGRGRDGLLAELHQVTSDVGGAWHHLHDDDPATALIEFARAAGVTQIVLGASDRNGWQELAGGGSIVRRVARLAARAGIDVHIVAAREGLSRS